MDIYQAKQEFIKEYLNEIDMIGIGIINQKDQEVLRVLVQNSHSKFSNAIKEMGRFKGYPIIVIESEVPQLQ